MVTANNVLSASAYFSGNIGNALWHLIDIFRDNYPTVDCDALKRRMWFWIFQKLTNVINDIISSYSVVSNKKKIFDNYLSVSSVYRKS